ncbi:DUF2608 domain-containing protein [Candidatus Protochlamydia phocaeensis]|uniref:DUF2608 domain-containing protein n=1 Tax=Candidatus Protochlamydia phocaeensis TaxID=1414722 RepID=UPI0008385362|nr:DUF2608 domain-containing protein [Candidatus Protochlamydia phocaeensis]
MKKFCLTLLLAFCILSCHAYAQTTQVENMKEVFNYIQNANSKTLVIFDVDMVLVQPSDPAFQMANMKRFSTISKRIMKEVPEDKQMIFLSLMTIHSKPVLLDDRIPQFLQGIIDKGVPTMAMTANLTGRFGPIQNMEKWRIESLQQLGIDFSKSAPYSASIIFDDLTSYRENYSKYLNGILFVNGTMISKGEALLAFLEKTDFYPEKIIFIDDRQDNLKSVEIFLKKLDKAIQYQGIHFIGAQKYPSKIISESDFESRWQQLAYEAKEIN